MRGFLSNIHPLISYIHLSAIVNDHWRGIAPQVPKLPQCAQELSVIAIRETMRLLNSICDGVSPERCDCVRFVWLILCS